MSGTNGEESEPNSFLMALARPEHAQGHGRAIIACGAHTCSRDLRSRGCQSEIRRYCHMAHKAAAGRQPWWRRAPVSVARPSYMMRGIDVKQWRWMMGWHRGARTGHLVNISAFRGQLQRMASMMLACPALLSCPAASRRARRPRAGHSRDSQRRAGRAKVVPQRHDLRRVLQAARGLHPGSLSVLID